MLDDRFKRIKKGKWISEYYSDPNRDDDAVTGRFFDLTHFKRLFSYISKYKGYLVLALVSLALFSASQLVFPQVLKFFIDDVYAADIPHAEKLKWLYICVVIIIAVFLVRAVAAFGQTMFSALLAQKSMHHLRLDIFRHVLGHSTRFFGEQPVGRLLTRTTNDVLTLNELLGNSLIMLLSNLLIIAFSLFMMFRYSWTLTLLCLLASPLIVLVTALFRSKIRESFRKIRWLVARLNAFLAENLSGIRIIQLFRREKRSFQTFLELNVDTTLANLKQVFYSSVFTPTIEAIGAITKAFTYYFAASLVLTGPLEVGAMVAFFMYFDMALNPIRNLAEQYNVFQSAMASTERIFRLLDTEHEIVESDKTILPDKREGRVEFKGVTFAYEDDDYVLRDINLTIEPGESVALVGATGAGKSSMLNLLCRFYEAQHGTVEVNGVDVRDLPRNYLNRAIVLVPQDVLLFSDTIENNIKLWDDSISHEEIVEAAKNVNVHRFVSNLEKGYDTVLKERAAGISVGQKQLLSFARALAHSPEILVLDEATSSIDPETEALIQDALLKLMKNRTSIIVAHRLSTVRECDRIVVMHKGRIREVGSHDELMKQDGIYRKLYELQYKSQNLQAS